MPTFFRRFLTVVCVFGVAFLWAQPALAAEYFIDQNASNASDSGPGSSSQPWRSFVPANSDRIQPGDIVTVRAGAYRPQSGQNYVLRPFRSGTASAHITYRSAQGQEAILERALAIVDLTGRNYIRLEGFTVRDTLDTGSWARLWNANYNEIRGTNFTFSSAQPSDPVAAGWIGIEIAGSSYNKILDCQIGPWGEHDTSRRGRKGGDAIQMNSGRLLSGEGVTFSPAHHNLVQGCTIGSSQHSGLQIDGGYLNVIRNNSFSNMFEKTLELTDRGHVSADQYRWNFVEGNRFRAAMFDDNLHGGDHIHMNSSYNIVRNNIFTDSGTASILISTWGSETVRTIGNHFFNNVVAHNSIRQDLLMDCDATGVLIKNSGYTGSPNRDHQIKNNILFDNRPMDRCFTQARHTQLAIALEGSSATPNFYGIRVMGNIIYGQAPGENVLTTYGLPDGTVDSYQSSYGTAFSANLQQAPRFVAYDPGNRQDPNDGTYDFRLQVGSPGIDAGVDLTTTAAAGSGRNVVVRDALYFHDGFDGVIAPDRIRVGDQEVTVADINYTTNTITVDRDISWANNTPVNLPYSGARPDMGAYEFGGSSTPAPTPTATPSPTPSAACQADINGDGNVNAMDRTQLLTQFFRPATTTTVENLNRDSTVDILDYAILARAFGQTCTR